MRIYRTKQTINVGELTNEPVFKGQLFFVDSFMDLPGNPKDQKETVENWEELELFNNYGTVGFRKKI